MTVRAVPRPGPFPSHLVLLSLLASLLGPLAGCGDYRLVRPPPPPPAEPPGADPDQQGAPPDWNACASGWYGLYYNLEHDHLDVGEPPPLFSALSPAEPEQPPDLAALSALDWWAGERLAFEQWDPELGFGSSWWPVDQGWAQDPDYFAVRWSAWLRVWDDTRLAVSMAAGGDAWLFVGDELAAELIDQEEAESATFEIELDPGQRPLTLLYAHRGGMPAGLRFRILEGDVSLCYPELSDEE